jgi:hypothetical protein
MVGLPYSAGNQAERKIEREVGIQEDKNKPYTFLLSLLLRDSN